MKIVADTGPLIYLAQLDRLALLRDLYESYVPPSVQAEISAWPDEARQLIQTAARDWLTVHPIVDVHLRDYLIPQVDLGEAEVIALAVELGVPHVLLDDQDARRAARLYHLKPIGTLGLLLQAKRQGLLGEIRSEIDRLAQTNFYFSKGLIDEILHAAGEAQT